MKTIVFAGGGTEGHVIPNIALIDELESEFRCCYIGAGEVERRLIQDTYPDGGVKCFHIKARKFRRKLTHGNLLLPFYFVKSVYRAEKIIKHVKPSLVFSKGGFVSLPFVVAGWLKRIPVLAHEGDLSPGLANKLSKPSCRKVILIFGTAL